MARFSTAAIACSEKVGLEHGQFSRSCFRLKGTAKFRKEATMAESSPQTFANHVRLDPPFHFFVLPVLAISWIISVVVLVRHPHALHIWIVVFNTAIIVLATKTRLYALKVQDRVIRLEERLRLTTLLPDSLRPQIAKLSEGQLVALRFASDAEIPALVEKALSANLAPADIKKAIKNWRPDYWRV
jgi:uncharacterized protein DUF6526